MTAAQSLAPREIFYDSEGRSSFTFMELASTLSSPSLDAAAILGVLSQTAPTGTRTLLQEVHRQQWLHDVESGTRFSLPAHSRNWTTPQSMAASMLKLLRREALAAVAGASEIYVLTSGGLDSRVVVAVLASLYREGQLPVKPRCVTWGSSDSRDVIYAQEVARVAGFDWEHIPLHEQTILDNLTHSVEYLGLLSPPNHLHGMLWFERLPRDAVVLAGSYGDSIGRGEYSGRHLLELESMTANNVLHLLSADGLATGRAGIRSDLEALRQLAGDRPAYAHFEIQQQGFYMRNMIAHCMGVISRYCRLYQMFTSPEIWEYVWSLHPAVRDDRMYRHLLVTLNPEIASIPWARTNKSLVRSQASGNKDARRIFHNFYPRIAQYLREGYLDFLDPGWFQQTGIFNGQVVRALGEAVAREDAALMSTRMRTYGIAWWLVGLRVLCDRVQPLSVDENGAGGVGSQEATPKDSGGLRDWLGQHPALHRCVKRGRKKLLTALSLVQYPPTFIH